MRRARSQADADGATVTTRSRNDGMRVHGTARNRAGGITTTGPSPSPAAAPPSSAASSAAPLYFSPISSPGCRRPWARRRSTKRFSWTSRSGTLPTVCRRTRRSATTTTCRTPSTVTSSISVAGPSSSKSSSRLNWPSPGSWRPGNLRVRAWTAASSRRRSRSRAFRREAAISVSLSSRLTLRRASSSAVSSLSSRSGVLRATSAVARHRSLQNSSRRTSPRRSASRWASVASSAPCAVPYARNSVAPSRIWCSSRASSPRAQAATVARALPRASACRARASQATLRGSGGPRRRDLRGALEMRVGLGHAPPAQRDAPGEQVRLHRLAGPGRVETGGDLARRSGARRRNARRRRTWPRRGRGRRAPPRGSAPASGTAGAPDVPAALASAGWPAARAAVAAAKSSSAFLYAIPPSGGSPAERGVRLLRRFCGQPGGQQRRAAVDGKVGVGLAERVVAVPCLVEIGERLGKVAADQRHQPAVMPGLGVLEFLPAGGEHLLGPGVVRGRTPGQAEPEEDLRLDGSATGPPIPCRLSRRK